MVYRVFVLHRAQFSETPVDANIVQALTTQLASSGGRWMTPDPFLERHLKKQVNTHDV